MAGKTIFLIHGIWFFATNPPLWRATLCPLIVNCIFAIVITFVYFFHFLIPQIEMLENLEHVNHFFATIMALILTFLEIVVTIFAFALIVLNYYKQRLENRVYELKDLHLEDKSTCWGDTVTGVKITILTLVIFLVSLPLNFLPILGTAFFFAINGVMMGWSLHADYFSLKGMNFAQQYGYVKQNWKDYMGFGCCAILLNTIPLLNMLTVFTNIIGATLWAVEIEKNSSLESYITPESRSSQATIVTAAPAPPPSEAENSGAGVSDDIEMAAPSTITAQSKPGYDNIE